MIVVWRTKCSVSVFYMGFSYGKMTWADIVQVLSFALALHHYLLNFVALAVCALKYCV